MAEFIQYGGSNGGSYASHFSCKLSVWENSYDVSSNSSNVGYRLELISGSSGRFSGLTASYTVCIDSQGTPQYNQGNGTYSSQSYNTAQTICEGTFTVYHNADGSKNIGCWASLDFQSHSYSPGDFGPSGYMDLTHIPRASTPTCITHPYTTNNIGVLGDTITIHMNRASDSFTHNVYCGWYAKTITIATNVGVNCQWTVPKDFANNIPNAVSGWGTIFVDTYNGGTYIGTKSVTFSVSVPDTDEFYPNISALSGVIGENAESGVPQDWGIYIQNQSKIDYQILGAGVYSSTIKSYKAVVNGVTYTTQTGTTDRLSLSGTNSLVMSITDSRGRTKTLTDIFEVVEYNGPSITKFEANRCDEDGTLNEEGEYAKIDISATVPTLNNKNTYSYNFQYKDTDENQYTTYEVALTEVKTDTEVTIGGSFIIPADGNNAFDYMFLVSDTFNPNINKVTDIGTAFQLFNWNASGRGFAMGKVSEKDAFEINMDIYAEKNIYDKFGQLVNGKNIITAYLSQQYYAISKIDQIIPLDVSMVSGDKLSLDNNAVKIGAGVSKVMISAMVFYQDYGTEASYLFPRIEINDSTVSKAIASRCPDTNRYQTVTFAPFVINAKEGDLITLLSGEISPNNTGTIRGKDYNSWCTYMTVEVVE